MEIHKYYKAGLFSRELLLNIYHSNTGSGWRAAHAVTRHQGWGAGWAPHSFPFRSTCSLPPLTDIDSQ